MSGSVVSDEVADGLVDARLVKGNFSVEQNEVGDLHGPTETRHVAHFAFEGVLQLAAVAPDRVDK